MKSMDKFTLKESLEDLVFYRKIFSCFVYLGDCGITVLLRKPQYEVCPSKTCTRVHSGECVTTIRKNYHRHLDKCPIVAQVVFSHLQRIL
jgi:hypothetical protein